MWDINQKYKWYELFLVISLDRFSPFMTDIDFPLPNHLEDVQKLARNFINKFVAINQKVTSQDINDRFKELFKDIVDELNIVLGKENTNIFLEWGNEFETGSKEHSLFMFWESKTLRKLIDFRDYDDSLSQENFNLYNFYTLLIRCEKYLDGVFNTIDAVELMPKTDWDTKAYKIYHVGANREYEVEGLYHSPLSALSTFIRYTKILEFLSNIAKYKSLEELLTELQLSDKQKSDILSLVQEA